MMFRKIVLAYMSSMKEVICSLIEDDVRHADLLNQLQAVGFNSEEHVLNVSETVFKLTELDKSPYVDILVCGYFDLIKAYHKQEVKNLDIFTESIYSYLMSFSRIHSLSGEA
jgi:hypothetical protein